MNCKNRRGYLLWEVMASIAIVTAMMMVMMPMIQTFSQTVDAKHKVFNRIAVDRGLRDQLYAQWHRLGAFGCFDAGRVIEIGSSQNRPSRIPKTTHDRASDWISGADVGLCSGYGLTQESELMVRLPCSGINTGDILQVSSCSAAEQTRVLGANKGVKTAQLANPHLFDRTVLVGTKKAFYWYVGKGKSGRNALWRKPSIAGNAVELFPGLFRMRLYPILDQDEDAIAETIAVQYGQFEVRQLKGLLIEYEYAIEQCARQLSLTKVYHTLRGDQWYYDASCHSIGKAMVVLGGVS